MRIHIIFDVFLTKDGRRKSIGGVETYISNLCNVFLHHGYEVSVYQISNQDFEKEYDGIKVYGYSIPANKRRGKHLLEKCRMYFDYKQDIVIFGNDLITCHAKNMRSITIQHGVFWDIPRRSCNSNLLFGIKYIIKCLEAWSIIKRASYSDRLICVDYNFLNWYRAVVPFSRIKMHVIPNFTRIAEYNVKPSDLDPNLPVKIIFARRFWDYRGTRIFLGAAQRLLSTYKNIDITLAGDGPDEGMLRHALEQYENIHFITYDSKESLFIHADMDIAVVPTLASEGTSLSLLEAMSAQCAVVCTNVGGMTNIVIDGYNGTMVNPDSGSLYEAIDALIVDADLRKKLADTAYKTAKEGFSFERWEASWIKVIESFEEV